MTAQSLLVTKNFQWANEHPEFIVRTSPADQDGYWVGAPGVFYDAQDMTLYLYYRLRRPRGAGRGYEARIAKSKDGITFTDIWTVTQEQLDSPSVERGALTKKNGEWVFYMSYVNGRTHRWQIDQVRANRIEQFDVNTRKLEIDSEAIGTHAVKDPFLFDVGPLSFMYVSFAPAELVQATDTGVDLHNNDDVFTTGRVRSHTGLAIGLGDGQHKWIGEVLGSSPHGWDSLVSRISGLIKVGDLYLAFYDGAADVKENYEERVGLALTSDLKNFYKIPDDGPWMQSQYGSLRYVAPVQTPDGTFLYYEARTESGGHVLCGRKMGSIG